MKRKKASDVRPGAQNYGILQNILFYIRFYWQYQRSFLYLAGAEILLGAVLPYFSIYLPKLVVELLTEGASLGRVVLTLGGFGLVYLCMRSVLGACREGKYFLYNGRRNDLIANVFFEKSASALQ